MTEFVMAAEGTVEAPGQEEYSTYMGHHHLESGACTEAETFM